MRTFWVFFIVLTSFLSAQAKSPQGHKVEEIFKAKCSDCHTKSTVYPWYFKMPIAKDIIQKDIDEAHSFFDMEEEFFDIKNDYDIAKHVIVRIQREVEHNAMPPLKYRALHWDKWLSAEEKKTILDWAEKLAGTVVEPITEDATIELDQNKVALGKILYHDTRLSGDDTISCASCHDLAKGGTDQARFSTGIKGAMGHINSPTVYNSGFNFKQFWDGRAEDLEAQAHGPVNNPAEMGSDWEQVIEKLRKDHDLVKLFKKTYQIKKSKEITGDMIANSIAEFEKSLVTPSRFDDYLLGDEEALSVQELEGYELFKKSNCTSCHLGINLGGDSFKKMGIVKDYFKDRREGLNGLAQLDAAKEDNGRINVTDKDSDMHKFKVPTLRNVELTYPYFHDGNVETLEEAVKIMAEYQSGVNLKEYEIDSIVAFLKSLTGKELVE